MKILVATDGSEHAASAIALLTRLVGLKEHEFVLLSISDARDVALVSTPIPGAIEMLLEELDKQARSALREHAVLFQGVEAIELLHRRGDAADTILQVADEVRADLIALGSRGLGPLSGPLLGSVSQRVASHSECSVLLGRAVPPKLDDGLQIILGVDGSKPAAAAARLLGQMQLQSLDEILCVQILTLVKAFRMDIVQKLSEVWIREKQLAEENLESTVAGLREQTEAKVSSRILEGESAGEAISQLAAKQETSLMVVGNRGLGAVQRFLLGSVSSYLLHHAPCGVLLVKSKKDLA